MPPAHIWALGHGRCRCARGSCSANTVVEYRARLAGAPLARAAAALSPFPCHPDTPAARVILLPHCPSTPPPAGRRRPLPPRGHGVPPADADGGWHVVQLLHRRGGPPAEHQGHHQPAGAWLPPPPSPSPSSFSFSSSPSGWEGCGVRTAAFLLPSGLSRTMGCWGGVSAHAWRRPSSLAAHRFSPPLHPFLPHAPTLPPAPRRLSTRSTAPPRAACTTARWAPPTFP